ncbi:MAG TPA: diacylglycerol kinase [Allosphingosinicella sp.]|jgi:diacylglycerol kinase (ATP)
MQFRLPVAVSPSASFKNRPFRERLGFALAGVATVFRRERSFRTQCALAGVASVVTVGFAMGPLWAALVAICIGVVLALEMANASLEYLIDLLHPEIAVEIKHAKDAAAGAVLVASGATACVGLLMALEWLAIL